MTLSTEWSIAIFSLCIGFVLGLFSDRIRRRFAKKDARQEKSNELAILLLQYRQKVHTVRLMLRTGAGRTLPGVGEGYFASQLKPPEDLLELVSLKHLPMQLPAA